MVMLSGKQTLLLGGARSGKSRLGQELALQLAGNSVTYLATAESLDEEMHARIKRHQRDRPTGWKTWEGNPRALANDISQMEGVLLLDCLTLWLARMLEHYDAGETEQEEQWLEQEAHLLDELRFLLRPAQYSHLILISNEVGLSLVPEQQLGRRFRDMQGRANQLVAQQADNVVFVAAGLPLWLKRL